MIGAIIGGAMKVGSPIFGGLSASKAMKERKNALAQRARENEDWFNRRYNEDATARADSQRMITLVGDAVRRRNRAAAGRAAVMGGTPEAVAATQEANNELIGNTTAQIMQDADARRENVEAQYMERKNQIRNAQDDLELQRANNITGAVQGVADAASGIASSFGGLQDGKEELEKAQNQTNA